MFIPSSHLYFFACPPAFFFGPGFDLAVRVGFFASSGIAHAFPNRIAPGIMPYLQNF
jgi:hypothetical protein